MLYLFTQLFSDFFHVLFFWLRFVFEFTLIIYIIVFLFESLCLKEPIHKYKCCPCYCNIKFSSCGGKSYSINRFNLVLSKSVVFHSFISRINCLSFLTLLLYFSVRCNGFLVDLFELHHLLWITFTLFPDEYNSNTFLKIRFQIYSAKYS